MQKLIAANWKMNLLRSEAKGLATQLTESLGDIPEGLEIVLIPPYTTLHTVRSAISGSGVELGAQNVFWENEGAYTGEISPGMLLDAGCKWVIIGHSERRLILGETDYMVRQKLSAALDAGLKVILCVGETLEEREMGKTIKFVAGQVEGALQDLELTEASDVVIAYEPVWAIGTGKHATPDEVEYVHKNIREITGSIYGELGSEIRILYGGSVNEESAYEILVTPGVDGALVGGASLDPISFMKIVEHAGE